MPNEEKERIIKMWRYEFKMDISRNEMVWVTYRKNAGSAEQYLFYDGIDEAINDMYDRVYRSVYFLCIVMSKGFYEL